MEQLSSSAPWHGFEQFCLQAFSFHMSEIPLDLLLSESSCDSLDIWKYKRENGCPVGGVVFAY